MKPQEPHRPIDTNEMKRRASEDVYLTVPMVAKRYHVKPATVHWWTSMRRIPFVKIKGHRPLYRLSDLERWEQEGQHEEYTY